MSCLSLCFSCGPDVDENALTIEKVLPGYWELIHAARNGKTTSSLEGTYFEFDTLGNISTNFSGNQAISGFKIAENSILYSESNKEKKLDYLLKSQDTLVFNTVLKKIHNFELTLLRVNKESK